MDKTYVVITNKGYWGRARSLLEALKNAKPAYPTEVTVYCYPDALVKPDSIQITDTGGVRFEYQNRDWDVPAGTFYVGNFQVSKRLAMTPINMSKKKK